MKHIDEALELATRVQESTPENLKTKIAVFKQLDEIACAFYPYW